MLFRIGFHFPPSVQDRTNFWNIQAVKPFEKKKSKAWWHNGAKTDKALFFEVFQSLLQERNI